MIKKEKEKEKTKADDLGPLGLQFAVGENSSTGYGRFLHSLHLR